MHSPPHMYMLLLPIVSDNVIDRCGAPGKVIEKRDDWQELASIMAYYFIYDKNKDKAYSE
jgi:hypothetical protein